MTTYRLITQEQLSNCALILLEKGSLSAEQLKSLCDIRTDHIIPIIQVMPHHDLYSAVRLLDEDEMRELGWVRL